MMLFFPKTVLFICGLTEVLEKLFSYSRKKIPCFLYSAKTPLETAHCFAQIKCKGFFAIVTVTQEKLLYRHL